jgi:hypothetical protein
MNNSLEEFEKYASEHALPDSIACFALWNWAQELESDNEHLKNLLENDPRLPQSMWGKRKIATAQSQQVSEIGLQCGGAQSLQQNCVNNQYSNYPITRFV